MNPILKTLLLASTPALLAGATQPATAPATQPAQTAQAQSTDPLVIPDGTSLQNPGPTFQRGSIQQWNNQEGNDLLIVDGIRF